jgi:hypothetical protein
MATVVLVTGGTGLVGKAIQHIIETEPVGSKYGKLPNETWIFASSSEGDLRLHPDLLLSALDLKNSTGTQNKRTSCMISTSRPMSSILPHLVRSAHLSIAPFNPALF